MTDPILQGTFRKKEEVIARRIADETLLVPIRGRLADMQRIFSLNSVAEFIWERIEEEVPAGRILSEIMKEFQVEEGEAAGDLKELLTDLCAEDLIEQVG